MGDRILGLIIFGLAIWYGWTAGSYEASFGDPLGPAAFPQMLSVPAALLSLFLIVRPDPDPSWPEHRRLLSQAATIAVLVAYAFFLEDLGFVLATTVAVIALSRLLGAGWLKSATSGVLMAVGLFVLFDTLLGLPLPLQPSFMG
ncbi:tripartite tricarboxylate transporter TctB family protein [Tianweitania sediminis]|uniref:Tripartite tricarboxylate transporter TctB family protein n=1 Tax=Tianweitania sediminis TaxID=1502156 RepID=A0A8J7R0D0_9HYPH|nr:tripartite tricarboxylate transporter TctB family protein [Tianweitania sediminis]MBP0437680.1 tripartite tricarboxylate transporter TctB family protein [Tianweitania sediminis]